MLAERPGASIRPKGASAKSAHGNYEMPQREQTWALERGQLPARELWMKGPLDQASSCQNCADQDASHPE